METENQQTMDMFKTENGKTMFKITPYDFSKYDTQSIDLSNRNIYTDLPNACATMLLLQAELEDTVSNHFMIMQILHPLFELQAFHYKKRYEIQKGNIFPDYGLAVVENRYDDTFNLMLDDFHGVICSLLQMEHDSFGILCSNLQIQVPQVIADYHRGVKMEIGDMREIHKNLREDDIMDAIYRFPFYWSVIDGRNNEYF
jgi:hypothetical protein